MAIRIFIAHATEDKVAIARPLAAALQARGYVVWYDEYVLHVGDSLLRKIDEGLSECDFGIVILSPEFFQKSWPRRELDGLATREQAESSKIVLPVWHGITAAELLKISPPLADRVGVKTSDGLEAVVRALVLAMDAASQRLAEHVEASARSSDRIPADQTKRTSRGAAVNGFVHSIAKPSRWKAFWADPVWSKVLGSLIVMFLVAISAFVIERWNALRDAKESEPTAIPGVAITGDCVSPADYVQRVYSANGKAIEYSMTPHSKASRVRVEFFGKRGEVPHANSIVELQRAGGRFDVPADALPKQQRSFNFVVSLPGGCEQWAFVRASAVEEPGNYVGIKNPGGEGEAFFLRSRPDQVGTSESTKQGLASRRSESKQPGNPGDMVRRDIEALLATCASGYEQGFRKYQAGDMSLAMLPLQERCFARADDASAVLDYWSVPRASQYVRLQLTDVRELGPHSAAGTVRLIFATESVELLHQVRFSRVRGAWRVADAALFRS